MSRSFASLCICESFERCAQQFVSRAWSRVLLLSTVLGFEASLVSVVRAEETCLRSDAIVFHCSDWCRFSDSSDRVFTRRRLKMLGEEQPKRVCLRGGISLAIDGCTSILTNSRISSSEALLFYRRGYYPCFAHVFDGDAKREWRVAQSVEEREVAIDTIITLDDRFGFERGETPWYRIWPLGEDTVAACPKDGWSAIPFPDFDPNNERCLPISVDVKKRLAIWRTKESQCEFDGFVLVLRFALQEYRFLKKEVGEENPGAPVLLPEVYSLLHAPVLFKQQGTTLLMPVGVHCDDMPSLDSRVAAVRKRIAAKVSYLEQIAGRVGDPGKERELPKKVQSAPEDSPRRCP